MLNSESLDFERFHASESLERLALRDLDRLRTEENSKWKRACVPSLPVLTIHCSTLHKP